MQRRQINFFLSTHIEKNSRYLFVTASLSKTLGLCEAMTTQLRISRPFIAHMSGRISFSSTKIVIKLSYPSAKLSAAAKSNHSQTREKFISHVYQIGRIRQIFCDSMCQCCAERKRDERKVVEKGMTERKQLSDRHQANK